MKDYFERRLNRDEATGLYKCTVPELGIEVTADTEVSAIVDARKEVLNYKPTAQAPPIPQHSFPPDLVDARRYMQGTPMRGSACNSCGRQKDALTHPPYDCGPPF